MISAPVSTAPRPPYGSPEQRAMFETFQRARQAERDQAERDAVVLSGVTWYAYGRLGIWIGEDSPAYADAQRLGRSWSHYGDSGYWISYIQASQIARGIEPAPLAEDPLQWP